MSTQEGQEAKRAGLLRDMATVLRFHWRTHPGWSAAAWGGMALAGFIPVATILATGSVVSAAQSFHSAGSAAELLTAITTWAALSLAGSLLASYLGGTVTNELALRVAAEVDARLLTSSLGPPGISHLESPEFPNGVRLARGVGNATPSSTAYFGPQLLPGFITAFGAALIVASHAPVVCAVLIVTGAAQARLVAAEHAKLQEAYVEGAGALRRAEYYFDLSFAPDAAKELRVLGMNRWLLAQFGRAWLNGMRTLWRSRRTIRLGAAVTVLLNAAAMGGALIYLAGLAERGQIGVAAFAVMLQALPLLAGVGAASSEVQLFRNAAEPLKHLLALPRYAGRIGGGKARSEGPVMRPGGDIVLKDVSFAYPGTETLVLRELNLTIPAGMSTAIVGLNGTGKTTLIKILTRLYEPSKGTITYGGLPIEDIPIDEWREWVGVAFQDFARLPLPLHDNVRFGAARAELISRGERLGDGDLGLSELMAELPLGWDTPLSRAFDGGVDLSGGQWNRVALARAVVGAAPGGVLVLDEPTASLDIAAETRVVTELIRRADDVTRIVVSHRLSTVRHADRIVVIQAGSVVESGSHAELMATDGVYADLFRRQAAQYGVND